MVKKHKMQTVESFDSLAFALYLPARIKVSAGRKIANGKKRTKTAPGLLTGSAQSLAVKLYDDNIACCSVPEDEPGW